MFYFAQSPLPDTAPILAGDEDAWMLTELDDVYGLTVEPVSEEASRLLDAAKAWPPAMALAASAIDKLEDVTTDFSMFDTMICELLPWFLAIRERGTFLQTKSKIAEPDYRDEGELFWLVARRDSDVLWISRDFQIYDAPAADFELTEAQLYALPDRVPLPKWLGSRSTN